MIVDISPLNKISFSPATERDEIVQNVATIISTVRYSVPYDREFGINPEYLDDPSLISRSRLIADIVAKIKKYEPRAKVVSVDFKEDGAEGILKPIVRIDLNV